MNQSFNSLPNDKILDLSKSKAFADDKIKVTQKLKIKLGRVQNIVGKEENAGNHFNKEGFWKHRGKRRKKLVTSIFSFSHNIFYHTMHKFKFLSCDSFVICKCFECGLI